MPNSPKKDRPRVQFVCDQWVKEYIDQWAGLENRSTSNLIETIVLGAVHARQADEELTDKPDQISRGRQAKKDNQIAEGNKQSRTS
jgi:hypothetical protein